MHQGLLSNWKTCFDVFNLVSYDEFWCNLSKITKNVWRTISTNFPIYCQQITKTALKCDTESFGPVSQLWSVTQKSMHDSKQHHNWLMWHKTQQMKTNT